MKRKRNPIRGTVAHVVSAGKWKRDKKPKRMMVLDFFDDLENRGAMIPSCLIEKWARRIKRDMVKAKLWNGNDESKRLAFVAEYVRRMQDEFWKVHRRRYKHLREDFSFVNCRNHYGWFCRYERERKAFETMYRKIRGWGLRTKMFRLRRDSTWIMTVMSYVAPHPSVLKGERDEKGVEYYNNDLRDAYLKQTLFITPPGSDGWENRFRNAHILSWIEMFRWWCPSYDSLHP